MATAAVAGGGSRYPAPRCRVVSGHTACRSSAHGTHTRAVDYRIETFEGQASTNFGFLTARGCTQSSTRTGDDSRRPFSLTVTFHGAEVRVETMLVLEVAGDDSVVTIVETLGERWELPSASAHKGHEMRKALMSHADEVRQILAAAN